MGHFLCQNMLIWEWYYCYHITLCKQANKCIFQNVKLFLLWWKRREAATMATNPFGRGGALMLFDDGRWLCCVVCAVLFPPVSQFTDWTRAGYVLLPFEMWKKDNSQCTLLHICSFSKTKKNKAWSSFVWSSPLWRGRISGLQKIKISERLQIGIFYTP